MVQEFRFAHPRSTAEVNRIQNSHFYGSVLWNLSSQEVGQLEKSWNVSMRIMFNLPRETHCYLIEEVSEQLHVKTILARRSLIFIQAVRGGKKKALRDLLKVVELDTQSVTGRNLRNILIQTDVHDVRKLEASDYKVKYRTVPSNEEYRVEFIKELIDVNNNQLEVPGFDDDELEDILQYLCVS